MKLFPIITRINLTSKIYFRAVGKVGYLQVELPQEGQESLRQDMEL